MHLSREEFEEIVRQAIDSLPDDLVEKTNNVAFFVEDHPSAEQKKKFNLKKDYTLFGLYEGYYQSSRQNIGAVLPDRITLFRKPITDSFCTVEEVKCQVAKTLKHEIAHHLGSDEKGARRASVSIK